MSKIPEGLKCEITPEQAYAKGIPDIPEGWEFVKFAVPTEKDQWLGAPDGGVIAVWTGASHGPRIIVRRGEPVRMMISRDFPNAEWLHGKPHPETKDCYISPRCVPYESAAKPREVKPIKRRDISLAFKGEAITTEAVVIRLRELGIDVGD